MLPRCQGAGSRLRLLLLVDARVTAAHAVPIHTLQREQPLLPGGHRLDEAAAAPFGQRQVASASPA